MPYNEDGARSVLAALHAKKFADDYRAKRLAAAERLRTAAIVAARTAGWTLRKEEALRGSGEKPSERMAIETWPGRAAQVWIVASDAGLRMGRQTHGMPDGGVETVPIVYEASRDEWAAEDGGDALLLTVGILAKLLEHF